MNSNSIFKQGSKTYYTASLFFPKGIRKDVTRLYAFVRTADNFVDQIPADKKGFFNFKKQTNDAFSNKNVPNEIVMDFYLLCRKFNIEKAWVDSFLTAMEQDLTKKKYTTYSQLEKYMYGSAEVIGLMMARILRLPKKAENAAQQQGKAMQLLNFIRDIDEDIQLGRQYVPQKDLEMFGIKKISPNVNRKAFSNVITFEVERYKALQNKASKGYPLIPRSARIPIATAASMYSWTAEQILKDPLVIFKRKVKPSKKRIIMEYIKHFFTI